MTKDDRSQLPIPVATIALTVLMIGAFGMELRAMRWGIMGPVMDDFAFSWTAFIGDPFANLPKLLSHTFLHANTAHITGNLIFFALFAPAVERAMGHLLFTVLYLVWGVSAACTQGFFEPYSSGMIGASGAISGAAGAYFVLYPLRTPPTYVTRLFGRIAANIPAFFWIGLWFLAQLKGGFRSLAPDLLAAERVAYWAHIGGFAAGAISAGPLVFRAGKKDSE